MHKYGNRYKNIVFKEQQFCGKTCCGASLYINGGKITATGKTNYILNKVSQVSYRKSSVKNYKSFYYIKNSRKACIVKPLINLMSLKYVTEPFHTRCCSLVTVRHITVLRLYNISNHNLESIIHRNLMAEKLGKFGVAFNQVLEFLEYGNFQVLIEYLEGTYLVEM